MKTLGVALSGGGIRGLAHVGVLQVLGEAGIPVHRYSGASAGALVGVMAAAGCSINDMLDFWLDSHPFARKHMAGIRKPGLFDACKYIDLLKGFVKCDLFEELSTPMTVAVTAMIEGRAKYVDEGPLWPIVLASAAFPMVFSPVRLGEEVFMDGGITDNFPVAAVRERCDVVLGVNVSPRRRLEPNALTSRFEVLERVVDLAFRVGTNAACSGCDVLVVPENIAAVGSFDTSDGLAIYVAGVEAGRGMLPRLQALLGDERPSSV